MSRGEHWFLGQMLRRTYARDLGFSAFKICWLPL